MAFEDILYQSSDGLAIITLNRPDKLNAWTRVMERELRDAMTQATADDAVRVIILTGAGRGFCAGADMSVLSALTDDPSDSGVSSQSGPVDGGLDLPDDFCRRYSYFPTVPKPIIAAINGPCAGLGLVMALYADVRFAADAAVFTTAFSRRGLIAEHGISWTLPQFIGLPAALDLLLSGRKVDAAEALRLGLVNQIFPLDSFMTKVEAYAKDLAMNVSPRSMRVIKTQLYRAQFQSLGEASDSGDEEIALSLKSEDFREGVAHFVEKRAPAFTGR